MNVFSIKRIALFLFAGVLGLTVLQPAAAQTHEVTVTVDPINKIVAPGDVTININPSNGDFTGTAATDSGYDVTSNDPNGRIVQVHVIDNNNLGDVESLKILSSGTEAPSDAGTVDGDLELVSNGNVAISNPTQLTNSFTGVDAEDLPVQFEATVGPDFSPDQETPASITLEYTLTSASAE